jgi:hypothetical protein
MAIAAPNDSNVLSAMLQQDLLTANQLNTVIQTRKHERDLQQAQAIVYDFLLDSVKTKHPAEVLQEFRNLFIYQISDRCSEVVVALYEIVLENNESEFINTLKRACYTLINNWYVTRHYKSIQELIEVFENDKIHSKSLSPTTERLRQWLRDFIASKDYEELKLFAAKYDHKDHWINRFTPYLLVSQSINVNNPVEQREVARALSLQLKEQFKFDLAMYTARSQSALASDRVLKNPTGLGDEVFDLVKAIVLRRGPFNHANLAHIFVEQNQDVLYKDFKKNLVKYLVFSTGNQEFTKVISKNLTHKIETLYLEYDEELITEALWFRTCSKIIEYLISENPKEPSFLFILLLTQGYAVNLVVVLVKLVLICKNVRQPLEAYIARVIRYYEKFPESECQWVVTFLEIFKITFAIYAGDVEYSLVQMASDNNGKRSPLDLNTYRIFSQFKEARTLPERS